MICKNTRRGFTLIEMLVVVLIIGILAAVAVPQYQKLMEQYRVVEALSLVQQLKREIDVFVINNGYPRNEWISWKSLPLQMVPTGTHIGQGWYYTHNRWVWRARCWGTSCWIVVHRANVTGRSTFHDYSNYYVLQARKVKNNQGAWSYTCTPLANSQLGKNICTYLRKQGWIYEE